MKTEKKSTKMISIITVSLIFILLIWFLFAKTTVAWLEDRGKWQEEEYYIGKISYTYEINNKNISTEVQPQELIATVPIIGAVKINDSATVDINDVNYQKYAEENFNEGVTVVNITIDNKSDFIISGNYKLIFEGMFESGGKDIFYLILPQESKLDVNKKTVNNISYKNHIKSVLGANGYKTYDDIVSSLNNHYINNPGLKSGEFNMSPNQTDVSNHLTFNILFWSEYNNNLPFVNDDKLQNANPLSNIEGTFKFKFEINQETN